MKFVMTPVGTSLFDNFQDASHSGVHLQADREQLQDVSADEWERYQGTVSLILDNRSLHQWIRGTEAASAETESAAKIADRIGEPVEVRLLSSDTVVSRLAATLIAEHAEVEGVEAFRFRPEYDVITGLQVKDASTFETTGLRGLVDRLDTLIVDHHSAAHSSINITGGYKATLPYLSLMGQVYGVPMYYKFEGSDELLEIPKTPLDADWALIDRYESAFAALADTVTDVEGFYEQYPDLRRKAPGMIHEEEGVLAGLSPLGSVLWNRYCRKREVYHAPEKVVETIREQPHIQRILATKFDALRQGAQSKKVKEEGSHTTVFKDGNNPYRIYFFRDDGEVYIYQTFEDHDAHERYLTTPFGEDDRQRIIERSNRHTVLTT